MISKRVTIPPPMYMCRLLPWSVPGAATSPSLRSAAVPTEGRSTCGLEEEDEEEAVDDGDREGNADVVAPIAHASSVEPAVLLHLR